MAAADDSAIAVVSYIISDLIAQASEQRKRNEGDSDGDDDDDGDEAFEDQGDGFNNGEEKKTKSGLSDEDEVATPALDVERLRRYATFGAFDGIFSHAWYRWVDGAVVTWNDRWNETHVGATAAVTAGAAYWGDAQLVVAEQVAADMLLFSPCWCAAFLSAMAVMSLAGSSGGGEGPTARLYWQAATERLRREWRQLYVGNLLVWIPANGVVYGLAPVEHRVAAFSAINVAYTALLSVWAESERVGRESEAVGE